MRSEFDRFIEKVEVNENNCWVWTAAKYRGGYGHFRRFLEGKWKMFKAHRYAYEIYKGHIPEGLLICHTCDNPSCVNPEHLFTGTAKENTADRITKKGQPIFRNPLHNWLTKEIVNNIRDDYKSGLKYIELEVKYKLSKQQISRIVNFKTWK